MPSSLPPPHSSYKARNLGPSTLPCGQGFHQRQKTLAVCAELFSSVKRRLISKKIFLFRFFNQNYLQPLCLLFQVSGVWEVGDQWSSESLGFLITSWFSDTSCEPWLYMSHFSKRNQREEMCAVGLNILFETGWLGFKFKICNYTLLKQEGRYFLLWIVFILILLRKDKYLVAVSPFLLILMKWVALKVKWTLKFISKVIVAKVNEKWEVRRCCWVEDNADQHAVVTVPWEALHNNIPLSNENKIQFT